MRIIAFLAVTFCIYYDLIAQTDSTQIKLSYYKDLFIKGLIDSKEYEKMKSNVLGLSPESAPRVDTLPRYGVNVAVTGCYNYSAFYTPLKPGVYINGGFRQLPVHDGGIHIGVGPRIARRHRINIVLGLEGAQKTIMFPIYAQYGYNIIKGRISPVISAGGGYIGARWLNIANSNTKNGGYCMTGIALGITKDRFCFIFGPSYRALIFPYSGYTVNMNGSKTGDYNQLIFYHQFSLAASFVFY